MSYDRERPTLGSEVEGNLSLLNGAMSYDREWPTLGRRVEGNPPAGGLVRLLFCGIIRYVTRLGYRVVHLVELPFPQPPFFLCLRYSTPQVRRLRKKSIILPTVLLLV